MGPWLSPAVRKRKRDTGILHNVDDEDVLAHDSDLGSPRTGSG
jgi:hypothetical protein